MSSYYWLQLKHACSSIFTSKVCARYLLFHRRDRGLVVTRPTTPLDGRSLGNSIKPLQHMRERFHLLSREAANLPPYVHPRPRLDIRDGVFALSCTC